MDRKKAPFQDITSRFAAALPPTPSSRRRAKAPGGAMGEKKRLRVVDNSRSTNRALPSSLPPSSPPRPTSPSIGAPLDEFETGLDPFIDDENDVSFGRSDFESLSDKGEVDEDSDAENRAPANQSDPFGFFAIERKLKAERDAQPHPAPHHASAIEHYPARLTDDKGRDDGRLMPATPHKPKAGKPSMESAAISLGSGVTTIPSSPSPVKGTPGLVGRAGNEQSPSLRRKHGSPGESSESDEESPPKKKTNPSPGDTPLRRSARHRPVKPDAARPARKITSTKTTSTKKKAVKGKGKRRKEEADEEQEEEEEHQGQVDKVSRQDAERKARVEYFKKLDHYSFEKEDVYVV
ncbi:unnamed protein product [Mycena citricolor]|uniref:Uncharacterized protein n=1 Tax=Mycena citricolor TaxID=2018698 RepID=A0AAD2JWR3_9AGAR|nr:unnamed protein product [Mycena citricolor]